MNQLTVAADAWINAHPYAFAALTGFGGLILKTFVLTVGNAKKAVRAYFTWQRAQLKKAGKSETQIQAIMEDEAAFLTAAAQEAKTEADEEVAPPAAAPTPTPPATPAA